MTTYTIKPLTWEQDGDMWIARTPFGILRITRMHMYDAYRARSEFSIVPEPIGHKHESFEAAKQACAEHWEGMIRQALEVCDGN